MIYHSDQSQVSTTSNAQAHEATTLTTGDAGVHALPHQTWSSTISKASRRVSWPRGVVSGRSDPLTFLCFHSGVTLGSRSLI